MQNKIKYLKSLPKKQIAVGVLLFNYKNELLILQPSYKDGWTIPGGVTNANESPIESAVREAKEETGLDIKLSKCLGAEYKSENFDKHFHESIQIIFLGKRLSKKDIAKIKIDNKEIIGFKFLPFPQAIKMLTTKLGKRINGLNKNFSDFVFLENGKQIIKN